MKYRSIAPDIQTSCYNCRFFETSKDMLIGTCHYFGPDQVKSSIGIGTCDYFSVRTTIAQPEVSRAR